MLDVDYDQLASELLRALRGKRSQAAFARRLGYRSNVVYSWESGRAFPTAAKTLFAAERVGVEVRMGLQGFLRGEPDWLRREELGLVELVPELIDTLRGNTSIVELARAAGLSRYALRRWLDGSTEPRLPDLLRVVEAASQRCLDFLAVFVDPATLPQVASAWRELHAARQAAYDQPWSQAVLRALELSDYQELSKHSVGWLSCRLGIPLEVEERALELLVESGQLQLEEGRYRVMHPDRVIDTRRDPAAARPLRSFWMEVALERLKEGSPGTFAHNVFGVSREDFERIRLLQKDYFQEVRSIVAASQPVEVIGLLNLQLLELDGGVGGASARD